MGLELAEITLDLEETCGVTLDWDGRLRTVGDLQQAVADAVQRAATASASAARERYTAEITAALGITAADLDRPILTAVPDLPRRLPDLGATSWWRRPSQMRRPRLVVIALWAITPMAMAILWAASPQDRSVAIAGLVLGPMLAAVLAYVTTGWRPRLPDLGGTTPRDLIEEAVTRFLRHDPAVVATWMSDGAVRRAALDAQVVTIIAERGGLPLERVVPSARLVDDLGLG